MVIIAIDLASNPSNDTGIAVLSGGRISCSTLRTDEEIISFAMACKATLAGIDAPLTIPAGRSDIDDRSGPHFRECDLKLRSLGIRFFPVTLGAMRSLTKRGMGLAQTLRSSGIKTHEIFPGASFDRFGIPRKDAESTNRFLSGWGCEATNIHESDAAIGAYTLWLHKEGGSTVLEGPDGAIILPGLR